MFVPYRVAMAAYIQGVHVGFFNNGDEQCVARCSGGGRYARRSFMRVARMTGANQFEIYENVTIDQAHNAPIPEIWM